MRLPFAFRLVVLQLRDRAAGDGPEVEAGHAAVWAVAAAVFFKQPAVDRAVVVEHAQAAPDGQIVIAENVGPLQGEEQEHLGRPDADALEAAERPDGICIAHVRHGVQIKCAGVDLFGEVRDVFRLAEGHEIGRGDARLRRQRQTRGDI